MMGITRRSFIRYSVMPGITPRLKELFMSGFQYVPQFMALVYQAVRLLPENHPYTNPANLGKFGMRHVIAEAANNLTLNRQNLDQILLFITLLFGLGIVFVQIALLCISFLAGTAMAAMPTNFAGFFMIPAADRPHDLAYMMFDLIFGIPNSSAGTPLFGSCFATPDNCMDTNGATNAGRPITSYPSGGEFLQTLNWPFPIHQGLHAMFLMYNTGLMVVGALILSYFMVTVMMETAQTGTPFGKRFNKAWAPLRVVVAFGLLIPFSTAAGGLNSSQYIVLYAAKFGSNFATNGWRIFNQTLGAGTNPAAASFDLVSKPKTPDVTGLLQFMFAAATCRELEYESSNGRDGVGMYAVKDNMSTQNNLQITQEIFSGPYVAPPTYQALLNFANGDRQIIFRFGRLDATKYPAERGNVSATCGEIVLSLADSRDPIAPDVRDRPEGAAVVLQAYYYSMLVELWMRTYFAFQNETPVPPEVSAWSNPALHRFAWNMVQLHTQWDKNPSAMRPPPEYKSALKALYSNDIEAVLTGTVAASGQSLGARARSSWAPEVGTRGALVIARDPTNPSWQVQGALMQKGWAAAGIWYNKIAEVNGVVSTATYNLPMPVRYPAVMEQVKKKKLQQDKKVAFSKLFEPVIEAKNDVTSQRPVDEQMQIALWQAYSYWAADSGGSTSGMAKSNNSIMDFIKELFGTSGLYSMRENPTVHPLAQLVGVGRSLIESATRKIGYSFAATIVGAGLDSLGGALASVSISMMMTIATIALTAGFILYYIVPFLPFIYFFFAVGGWFKAIFQAMVGAPLWALAHLRIDGPGLAGQAAVGGYFLILEIFLRPILIVFALLASISVFAAMVAALNQTWDIVLANLSGFDTEGEALSGGGVTSLLNFFRGPVDGFFFTVIYTIVVYIMAMSSFKMVDIIPANILRWMGQAVATFNDAREDAGQSLTGTATIGAQQGISGISSSFSSAMQKMVNSNKAS